MIFQGCKPHLGPCKCHTLRTRTLNDLGNWTAIVKTLTCIYLQLGCNGPKLHHRFLCLRHPNRRENRVGGCALSPSKKIGHDREEMPALSSWLFEFNNTCPDAGLGGYVALSEAEQYAPRTFVWIGILLAAEQFCHAVVLALSSRKRLTFKLQTMPAFELPTAVAILWVMFTALSIFLVSITYRSNAAVLAKTFHVAAEATFLVLLSVAFGLYVCSALCALLVFIVLTMVLTLPCDETIYLAAVSGLILDAINFLAYAWFGITRANDSILWLLIGGLGWHAMYLLTFLGLVRWSMLGALTKAWLRVLGMYFNIIADEFVLHAVRCAMMHPRLGMVDLKEWANEHEAELLCVWTGNGLRVLGRLPENEVVRVFAFEPLRTAYTPLAWYYVFNAVLPFWGEVCLLRRDRTTTVTPSLLCAFGWLGSYDVVDIHMLPRSTAYVVSWNQVRSLYWIGLIICGVVLAYFP